MSQPLYFLPGVSRALLAGDDQMSTKINRALLAERGLAGVFADVTDKECVAFELHETPGGKAGCMLYYKTVAGRDPLVTTYKPTSQDWHTVNSGLMIGVEKDSPPTPEDMRRRKQIPGVAVELSEREYTIPVIRRIDGATTLPTQMFMDEAGNVLRPVQTKYADAWERFAEVSDWLIAKNVPMTDAKLLMFAVDAIAINYRFSMREQNTLRIIDGTTFFDVLVVAVDFGGAQELIEAQKKTASSPSGLNSTAG